MIRHEDIDDGPFVSKWHKVCCCLSCCLPCNWLLKPCRHAVSRKKKRFIQDTFDLDLTYLTPRIIVHGFPAAGVEHLYRNPRLELKRFLDTRHQDHYMLFNFCCEPGRGYDPNLFHGRVQRYPFKDHCCPPLETMAAFANAAKLWLEKDPENVCSMHCKAGKGRAGLMSCVLLVRTGFAQSAAGAMDHYDKERTHNGRGLTVTSQRKFVIFFERLWRDHWGVSGNIGDVSAVHPGENRFVVPRQPDMRLTGVKLITSKAGDLPALRLKVFQGTNFSPVLLCSSGGSDSKEPNAWSCDCVIKGNFNVKLEVMGGIGKPKKVLELWHNTLFVERGKTSVDFGVDQLDIKRKLMAKLGSDVVLQLIFTSRHSLPVSTGEVELAVVASATNSTTAEAAL